MRLCFCVLTLVAIQVYRTYVEAGRVAYVNFGEDYGKLCVIVDLIDDNSVLVDGKTFPRVQYPLSRLTLSKFCLPVLRGARTGTVIKAMKDFDLQKKWDNSSVAKKFALRQKRANLSDYERFAVMVNRKRRSFAVRKFAKNILAGGKKKVISKKKPAAKK